jgi:D-alanyl-lipoteichoic acid acyltransferase DltB (MBOAT superfamily)
MSLSELAHAQPARLPLGSFVRSAVQLGLLALVVRAFGLERSFGLDALMGVAFAGYCVHAWLPARFKLEFFLALSLVGFALVLGVRDAALVLALGLALIGIAHLPLGLAARALLLLASACVLAALRGGWWGLGARLFGEAGASWSARTSAAVVPVLGAIFMFRMVVYLQARRVEQRSGQAPASWSMRLAYFFLLPNACFVLFPVVDYASFRRTYYELPAAQIHQRGLDWMLRGILHLLAYRVVYVHWSPAPEEVRDLGGVVLFALSSYLLYLRVSGHFHLIVGLLHLFGFHLPETNHRYLLASSFSDCWRRINLYWTDFIKKLVYFPVYARLRKRSLPTRIAAATMLSFGATWLLHSYQWFWLHGSFPIAVDGLFWGIGGLLTCISMLLELRAAQKSGQPNAQRAPRAPGPPSWSSAFARSLRVFGVFCLVCAVWSLWCSDSLEQWLGILAQARHGSAAQRFGVASAVLALLFVGSLAQRVSSAPLARAVASAGAPRPQSGALPGGSLGTQLRAFATPAAALGLALIGQTQVRSAFGGELERVIAPLAGDALNERDRERATAGYYDRLVDRGGFGSRAGERARTDPNDEQTIFGSGVTQPAQGMQQFELRPSMQAMLHGALVETNRWGMRDREYERTKPPRTLRIALLGTCYEMGVGVSNAEVWEALLEERLNRELGAERGCTYEILNFSVPAYSLLLHLVQLRERVLSFEPDLVLVSNHTGSSVKNLISLCAEGQQLPPGLAEVVAEADLGPELDPTEIRRRLRPLNDDIERWALTEIRDLCQQAGAQPVYLALPFVDSTAGPLAPRAEHLLVQQHIAAHELGYECVELLDAFKGMRYEDVANVQLEHCPSAAGHRIVSERLHRALIAQPHLLALP